MFGIGNVVLKVIPLRNPEESELPEDYPFLSEVEDVLKEITVTRTVGQKCDGFIKVLG